MLSLCLFSLVHNHTCSLNKRPWCPQSYDVGEGMTPPMPPSKQYCDHAKFQQQQNLQSPTKPSSLFMTGPLRGAHTPAVLAWVSKGLADKQRVYQVQNLIHFTTATTERPRDMQTRYPGLDVAWITCPHGKFARVLYLHLVQATGSHKKIEACQRETVRHKRIETHRSLQRILECW